MKLYSGTVAHDRVFKQTCAVKSTGCPSGKSRLSVFFWKSFLLLCAFFSVGALQAQTPAFPTAEGFGKWATGGRGGKVVEVTTLADNAQTPVEGSFRWALQQYPDQPITVVFRVSGIIRLEGDIRCGRTAGTTIAGQTAPGDGICIRGAKCNFGGSKNLIIRHLRFRIGLDDNNDFLKGGSIGIENASNFIIDHCTFGWSGEENMTIYDNTLTTIQWCIVHEGLYDAGHGKGVRGYGCQWGGQSATYHHNLLAHNQSRSPRFNGARSNDVNVLIDFVNNVNYNWGGSGACYGADFDENGLSQRINFVGNYWKPGPAYPGSKSSNFVRNTANTNPKKLCTQWYMSGNYMEGSANASKNTDNYNGLDCSDFTKLGWKKSDICMKEPFEVSDPVKTETASEAYQSVLKGAGAFPRDTVDRRIVKEVSTGTASCRGSQSGVAPGIIDRPSDAGGYPTYETYNVVTDNDHDGMDDAWETAHGLDPGDPNDGRKILKSGYSALEAYLNGLCGEEIPVELGKVFDCVVAQDGSGDFTSINAAIQSVPADGQRHLIFIKNGTYREKVFIGNRWQSSKQIVSIIGEDRDKVVIEWDDYNGKSISYPGKDDNITADGMTCPTMTVTSPDFYMENVTVSNPSREAQAVALYQAGDRQVLKNCRITGYQDTYRTKKGNRYFLYQCQVEGAVDFIYAGGCAYFYQCDIVSVAGGYITAPEDVDYTSKLSDGNTLYYTFFFQDCNIKAASGVTSGCYLGRPWGEKSGSIFIGCKLGSHINAAGWTKMGEDTWKNCSFGEYNSLNAAGTAKADVSKRVDWSLQICEDDRFDLMTLEKIYKKIGGKTNVFDPLPSVVPVKPATTGNKMIKKFSSTGGYLSWVASPDAIGYVLYIGSELAGFSTANWFADPNTAAANYTIYAVSPNGGLSEVGTPTTKYDREATLAALRQAVNPVQQIKLSVAPSDLSMGSVSAVLVADGASIAPVDGKISGTFDKGTEVVLSASPAEGYDFIAWTNEAGDTLSRDTAFTYTMLSSSPITAVFDVHDALRALRADEGLNVSVSGGKLLIQTEMEVNEGLLYDLSGRLSCRFQGKECALAGLPKGIYVLSVGDGLGTRRFTRVAWF